MLVWNEAERPSALTWPVIECNRARVSHRHSTRRDDRVYLVQLLVAELWLVSVERNVGAVHCVGPLLRQARREHDVLRVNLAQGFEQGILYARFLHLHDGGPVVLDFLDEVSEHILGAERLPVLPLHLQVLWLLGCRHVLQGFANTPQDLFLGAHD